MNAQPSSKTTILVAVLSCVAIVGAALVQRKDIVPSPLAPTPSPAPAPAVRHQLLLFTEDGCAWCAKEKDAFAKSDLSAFAVSVVNDRWKDLTWSIHAFPTLVVCDQSGKELGRHEGYLAPDALEAWLKSYK